MIKWILQDVKRTLKSRKTYLLITVILISIGSFLFNNMKQSQSFDNLPPHLTEGQVIDNSFDQIYEMEFAFGFECTSSEEPLESCKDYNIFKNHVSSLFSVTDIQEEYALKLFLLDVATDGFLEYYDAQGEAFQEKIESKAIDIEMIRSIKNEIKDTISPEYETFELNLSSPTITNFNKQALDLYETYLNYQNHYPRNVKTVMTSSFFLANYLNEFFLLIILVAALLVFDSFYRDYQSGVIKTILSTPTRRFRYVIMKSLSSIMSMLLVVFVPLILTALVLLAYNGFDTLNYPVYISRTTLNSFDPALTYSRIINDEKTSTYFSTYKNICSVAPISKYPVDIPKANFGAVYDCTKLFPAAAITFISLSKYLTLVILYLILIIIFIASLNTLFSLLFNSQILNLIVLCATIGLSLVLSQLFIGNSLLKFIPFTFISPTALLMGTIPYTFFNGVITIGIWTLVLNVINYSVMKRRDFSY